ncbi:TolC family protein [Pseudoxanthomonas wuyuanensis]
MNRPVFRFRRIGARVLAITLALPMPAALAAPAAEGPGLARAMEAAWQRAVEARRAQGEAARARAGHIAARSFAAEAPSLEFSRRQGDWYGGTAASDVRETEVGLSWPLWLPGQRGAAVGAARTDIEWAQANMAVARLEVAGQVREAAWEVATRQAGLELAQARVDFLSKLAGDVERRVASGDLARSDSMAARADLLAAQAEQADARRELQASHSRWSVLTGLRALPDTRDIEKDSHADLDALQAGAGQPPQLRLAELTAERAQRRLALARKSRSDAPELTLGATEESEGPGLPVERSLTLALRVPLGTRARNAPLRAQAQSEADIAEAELTLARARHAADLEDARLAVELADRQLENERDRTGLLDERAALMRKAFSAGEIPLADLLLAMRYAAEAAADFARRHAEHGLAHARFLQVIGTLP